MNTQHTSTKRGGLQKKRILIELILTVIFYPLFILVYILSGFIPRDPETILIAPWFGTRSADNAWYLYHILKRKFNSTKKRLIIIVATHELKKKLESYNINVIYHYSLKSLLYHLRAKFYIVDFRLGTIKPLSGIFSRGATVLNLWHGVPLKRIERDINSRKDYQLLLKLTPWELDSSNKLIVSPSLYLANIFQSAFGVQITNILCAEYPRNIVIKNKQWVPSMFYAENKDIIQLINRLKGDNNVLILYTPTFRDNGYSLVEKWKINIDELDAILEKNNAFLFVKFHPSEPEESIERIIKEGKGKRIYVLPSDFDLYPILDYFDVLITDYSSIFFDFMILNRPIIFYQFDLQEYMKQRGLYFNPSEILVGPVAKTPEELYQWIRYYTKHKKDRYSINRKKLLPKIFRYKGEEEGLEPILNILIYGN